MSTPSELAAILAAAPGFAGKGDIAPVMQALGLGAGSPVAVGDDCAAIPDGDGWALLACEGMLARFVADSPWFAGWSAVMVNLSDVAAMGGRPVAVVNALWAQGADLAAPVLAGMAAACAAYGVPMVGGHSNLRADAGQLAVAVLGRARALLTSFDARPGDALVAAIDLRGAWHEPWPFWDAATAAPPDRLRGDLALMPQIAEARLATVAKDISQGGLVGTAAMLCEASGVGVRLELDAIPCPPGVDTARWLQAFPSFGYLLGTAPGRVEDLCARFAGRGIAAARIGTLDGSRRLCLARDGDTALVRDLGAAPLIGCGGPGHA